jgi:glycosyltransferase involved in cell wall biosynthesis
MREVRDSGENVRALVTGEEPVESRGAAESRTQELGLAPYISDLGSRDDHLRFLSAMDAFALPSYREGMPLAILEAMAAGLPIVATRVGGIPEVLRDNEEGFMIEPGDKSALADRIRLLARDLALRGAIARRSKARASEFTLDRMTASYEEVYRGS